MRKYLSGVDLARFEREYPITPVKLPSVKKIILPMSMHIGRPATPSVKIGDKVDRGDVVGKGDGDFSADIHTGVSGVVVGISEIIFSEGNRAPAVEIESDGEMRRAENLNAPSINSREDLIEAVRHGGIVGLGGAGFPTHVKLGSGADTVIELIVNCAECEPNITSDTATLLSRGEDVMCAVEMMQKWLGLKEVIFGVESSNREALEKLAEIIPRDKGIRLEKLPRYYPQGGEKVLIYHTTGKIVPTGSLPADVGAVVCNISTIAEIGKLLRTGEPLFDRCVSVTGGALRSPKNVICPIGTPISALLAFCGADTSDLCKVVYGGPMMGVHVPSSDYPILKNTNGIVACTRSEAETPPSTACIRCGACLESCPFNINPAEVARGYKSGDFDRAVRAGVRVCMECGCCSFVCPARLPLAQTNRLVKKILRDKKPNYAERGEGRSES